MGDETPKLGGLRCKFCADRLMIGRRRHEFHEIAPGKWIIVCMLCEEATEIGYGK